MSNVTKIQPKRIGFWKGIAKIIQSMEKTENDYIWDQIADLKNRQNEIEAKLEASQHQEPIARLSGR